MAAYRTVGLVLLPQGGAPVEYGDTGSPYTAFLRNRAEASGFDGTIDPVAQLAVPAGSWTYTAKGTAAKSNPGDAVARCELVSGPDFDRNRTPLDPPTAGVDHGPLSLQVVHTFASDGNTELNCVNDSGASPLSLAYARIAALRMSGTHSQHLSDSHFADLPAGVRPVVQAGWDDGPTAFDTGVGFDPVRSMSLPAGKWIVLGKGYLEREDADAQDVRVACRLGRGDSHDRTVSVLKRTGIGHSLEPFVLLLAGSFAARSNITLSCKAPSGADVSVLWIKLTAHEARTLARYPLR